jgi:hypothetical protein
MIRTIKGNLNQVMSLVETVFNPLCVGLDENGQLIPAFEFEELDDTTGYIQYDLEDLGDYNRNSLEVALFHRFQTPVLTNGLEVTSDVPALNTIHEIPSVFRITTTQKKAKETLENFFIYNGIPEEEVICLAFPIDLTSGINKVEMFVMNLDNDKLELLNKTAKTKVVAQKVNKKITKISNTMTATSQIMMQDVVDPLFKAGVKSTMTVAGCGAKTLVESGQIVVNEFLKAASAFSKEELMSSDEMIGIKHSLNKIMNKSGKAKVAATNGSWDL